MDRIVQRQLFADTVKHSEESRKSLKDLEKGRNKKEGRIQVTTAPKDPPGAGAAGSQGRKEAGGREESEERGEPSKNPGKAGGSQKGDGDGGGEEDGGEVTLSKLLTIALRCPSLFPGPYPNPQGSQVKGPEL